MGCGDPENPYDDNCCQTAGGSVLTRPGRRPTRPFHRWRVTHYQPLAFVPGDRASE